MYRSRTSVRWRTRPSVFYCLVQCCGWPAWRVGTFSLRGLSTPTHPFPFVDACDLDDSLTWAWWEDMLKKLRERRTKKLVGQIGRYLASKMYKYICHTHPTCHADFYISLASSEP